MSSRRVVRKEADFGPDIAAPKDRVAAPCSAPRKRGPRQPQPTDFQVTLEMPQSVPILEKELRAIEILLGGELQDLLSNNAKER